jgi:Uma2 family endonuclease
MGVPQPRSVYLASRTAFRTWAATQSGRFERIAGELIAISPERLSHTRTKARVWQALDRALRDQQVPCEALTDGATVEIGEDTDYEPDAVVNCGEPPPGDVIAVPNPVIVVEVLSPATAARDVGTKLADYFRVASIQHYLILNADRPQIVHHQRWHDGKIMTRIVSEGVVVLDPPGITISVGEIYGGQPGK